MNFFSLHDPIRWLFLGHALAGAVALVVLLIPLFSKKGSRLHVLSGWGYVGAMIFISGFLWIDATKS